MTRQNEAPSPTPHPGAPSYETQWKVEVAALRDAADDLEANPIRDDPSLLMKLLLPSCHEFAKAWLRARADQIEADHA